MIKKYLLKDFAALIRKSSQQIFNSTRQKYTNLEGQNIRNQGYEFHCSGGRRRAEATERRREWKDGSASCSLIRVSVADCCCTSLKRDGVDCPRHFISISTTSRTKRGVAESHRESEVVNVAMNEVAIQIKKKSKGTAWWNNFILTLQSSDRKRPGMQQWRRRRSP